MTCLPRITLAACVAIILGGCDSSARSRTPAAGHARFVNSREGLTGTCLERYVDFSFDYPAGWEVKRQGPGNTENYVQVTRWVGRKSVEQLSVGTLVSTDPQVDLITALPEVARAIVGEETRQTGEFQVVSQQWTRFAGLKAYEVRAISTWTPPGDPNRRVRFNERIVLLPDETKKRGVTLVMYEVEGMSSGGLKAITDSFRLGK